MQDLILLRHAQAVPASQDCEDIERPLSKRGMVEAKAVARWLLGHDFVPECTLCSPARRARMTAAPAMSAWPTCPTQLLDGIYAASPADLLAFLDASSQYRKVILVGHNPGIEQLLALLTQGRSDDFRGMPPAALAWIRFADPIEPGSGNLHAYWSP